MTGVSAHIASHHVREIKDPLTLIIMPAISLASFGFRWRLWWLSESVTILLPFGSSLVLFSYFCTHLEVHILDTVRVCVVSQGCVESKHKEK